MSELVRKLWPMRGVKGTLPPDPVVWQGPGQAKKIEMANKTRTVKNLGVNSIRKFGWINII